MFLFAPGRADAEVGSPMGEDIKRACHLDQDTWMAIGDACNKRTQLDTMGATSCICQRAPPLQHVTLGSAQGPQLKKMVHDPQAIETRSLRPLNDQAKGVAKLILATRKGIVGDLQSKAH